MAFRKCLARGHKEQPPQGAVKSTSKERYGGCVGPRAVDFGGVVAGSIGMLLVASKIYMEQTVKVMETLLWTWI